jgi:DNA repair photolyase
MEEKLAVKVNAPEILKKQLSNRARKGEYGIVFVGSATDAYMHHEQELKMTLHFLKRLLKFRFPVFVSTRCPLILRDVALLKEMDEAAVLPSDLRGKLHRGVILATSVTTMNEEIARALEPGAALPKERLEMIQQLKEEGFLAGVNAIPVLPFISDTEEELEKIISASAEHKADFVLAEGLTLFGSGTADSKTICFKFLERKFPQLLPEYHRLYGDNFYPPRRYQDQLREKANRLCAKHQISNSILEADVRGSKH